MPDENTNEQHEQREADVQEDSQVQVKVKGGDKDEALSRLGTQRDKERERANTLEQELNQLKAKQREADEAKAREEGNYKELLEQRDAELAELKAKLEQRDLKDRKAAIAKQHGIPDEAIGRLSGSTDEEIEEDAKALAKILKPREAPDTDAGERTPPGQKKVDKSKFADPAIWGLS